MTTTIENKIVWIVLPFKDEKHTGAVRRQLKELSTKININVQPVHNSLKIGDKLKICEKKPSLDSHQCVVDYYKCHLCDTDYID